MPRLTAWPKWWASSPTALLRCVSPPRFSRNNMTSGRMAAANVLGSTALQAELVQHGNHVVSGS